MDTFNRRTAKAKKEGHGGKRRDGDSEAGGDDEVFYDATLLTAPREVDEEKGNYSLEPTNETRRVAIAETSAKEAFSFRDPLLEVDASNVSAKTHPASEKDVSPTQEETPLDRTIATDLLGQQSSELDASVLSQTSSHVEHDAVSKTLEELDEVENVKRIAEPHNVKENSHGGNEITEDFEETITVEKEADMIQYQRCINGDEDFLPVMHL